MKLLFAGTPQIAAHYLDFLHQKYEISLVVTQSAKASGRGLLLSESAVATYARANNLNLIETDNINSEKIVEEINSSGAQVGVVVAFGQIIKSATRGALPKEFINLHFSYLPKLRGADPVAAAVRSGMSESGVSVFKLNDELDGGDIYSQIKAEISDYDTTENLFNKLLPLGEQSLIRSLDLISQNIAPIKQVGESSYAQKSSNSDLKIDWNRKGVEIINLVRSGFDKKLAWTVYQEQIIKIKDIKNADQKNFGNSGDLMLSETVLVQALDGVLEICQVIPAGRKQMRASDWGRGLRTKSGFFE